jgi:membrane-bound lytic murein transglycosylase A
VTQTGHWSKPEAQTKCRFQVLIAFLAAGVLTGCVDRSALPIDEKLKLSPVSFKSLPGWSNDEHSDALKPFWRSCVKLLQKSQQARFGKNQFGYVGAWQQVCRKLDRGRFKEKNYGRRFFEEMFRPYLVSGQTSGNSIGFFTGYYEPEISGALFRSGKFQTPLYERPNDLKRSPGPYFSRRQIKQGVLKNRVKPIAWIADPVDAFFLHIQGSGRIRLPDKNVLRVGFAGHNRHPYTAIGRVLIRRGAIERKNISMQSIRAWLLANPRHAPAVMEQNARYVFFRRLIEAGPIGAQGVALTPGRSLAVDSNFVSYGTPIWLDTKAPQLAARPFRRLLIAQDTGGAIKGVVRGDIFFGHGNIAAQNAGYMNREGKYYVLIPRLAAPST